MDFNLTEDQAMVRDMARDFSQRELAPRAAEWDEKGEFAPGVLEGMGRLGLMGMCVPEEWGGAGAAPFLGHHHAEDEIDGFAVRRIEVDGLRELDEHGDAVVDTLDAAMRKGGAPVEARAAEPFTVDQAFEDVVTRDIGKVADQQLAENFETVFLAARRGIAEDTIGPDYFLE